MEEAETIERLVGRAREGDRKAFDALVARHEAVLRDRVNRRLGKQLRSGLDVDDVLQEAFVRVWQAMGSFRWRGEGSFAGWLGTIAERVILEASRRARHGPVLELVRDLPGSGTSPSKGPRREERLQRLEKALAGLSPHHREVVRLALLDGLPVAEIAARLGRSSEAARKLLSRALAKLRESFGDTESLGLPARALADAGGDHGRR
ncbi:MAG: sigma-70 family RNA polymerase sigma factor [Planctomycetes bacterium]|nr:sigma-70 family RNA polymerase sigma factor [Planctomycetota bacterium]